MRATFGGIAGHLRQQEQEGKARRARSKSKKAGERSGKSKKIASFLCSFSESDVRRHCRPSPGGPFRFLRALAAEPFEAWPAGSKSTKGGQEGPGARARRQEKAAAKAKR